MISNLNDDIDNQETISNSSTNIDNQEMISNLSDDINNQETISNLTENIIEIFIKEANEDIMANPQIKTALETFIQNYRK
ncbi:7169_t:CDS:2, partial [Racocetra fulgida]